MGTDRPPTDRSPPATAAMALQAELAARTDRPRAEAEQPKRAAVREGELVGEVTCQKGDRCQGDIRSSPLRHR